VKSCHVNANEVTSCKLKLTGDDLLSAHMHT